MYVCIYIYTHKHTYSNISTHIAYIQYMTSTTTRTYLQYTSYIHTYIHTYIQYMEHDFKSLMESMHRPFRTSEVKCLMQQLLSGTEFMHRHWVIHRDLKTSNLLMDNSGNLKVCVCIYMYVYK